MTSRRLPLTVIHHNAATCTADVRQQSLAHVPFFAELDSQEIAALNERCRIHDFEAGEAVLHAGDPADHLYVVAAGTAKVVRPTLDGTEVLLDIARRGDFFGALPALGADTYADSVWALTDLCVLSLDIDTFDELLDEHPSVARSGLRVIAERLSTARTHIHAVAAATSQQRVAGALVMLARRAGVPDQGQILLDLPLSRDDLASLTGTASETVSRVLSQLRRDGMIETGRRWISITDLDGLEDLAVV